MACRGSLLTNGNAISAPAVGINSHPIFQAKTSHPSRYRLKGVLRPDRPQSTTTAHNKNERESSRLPLASGKRCTSLKLLTQT